MLKRLIKNKYIEVMKCLKRETIIILSSTASIGNLKWDGAEDDLQGAEHWE